MAPGLGVELCLGDALVARESETRGLCRARSADGAPPWGTTGAGNAGSITPFRHSTGTFSGTALDSTSASYCVDGRTKATCSILNRRW